MLTPFDYLLLALVGTLVGGLASMVGVGGGFVMSPLLYILFSFDPAYFGLAGTQVDLLYDYARATSLFAIIFNASASSISYSTQKPRLPHYKVGLVSAAVTIPSSMISAQIAYIMPKDLFSIIFSISMSVLAIKMIAFPKKSNDKDKDIISPYSCFDESEYDNLIWGVPKNLLILTVIFSSFAGVTAGMLGLGGGVIMVPILTQILCLPIHIAAPTSLFIMIFTSISGSVINYANDLILFDLAICIGIGFIIGSQIGTRTVKKFRSELLQQLFAVVMLLAMIKLPIGARTIESWLIIIGIWGILVIFSFWVKNHYENRKAKSIS